MELIPVTRSRFDAVYEKMEAAFPFEERREKADEEKCFLKKEFHLEEIIKNGEAVGFTAFWQFNEYIFIEHIAINSDKRSGGFGSECIELIKEKYKLPIILEAEKPAGIIEKRRIAFYERLGFLVNDYDYFQPSYHGEENVPLAVLSYPKLLTETEFKRFNEETRQAVYNISL